MEATCWKHDAAPDFDHTCGIYAHREGDAIVDEVLKRGPLLGEVVFGEVALWGRVIAGTLGWRAQFAYPSEGVYLVTFGWDWWKPAVVRREQILHDLDAYGRGAISMNREEFVDQLKAPGFRGN